MLLAACGSRAQRAAEAAAEGQQLLDLGRYGEAAARLSYAAGQRDDLPGLWLLLGRAKAALRDAPGAFSAYRNALDQDPGSREALLALGQLSLAAGRYEESEDYADRLLLLSPGTPDALVIKGFAALGAGRTADALTSADAALKIEPSNELALTIKSMVAFRAGDLVAASTFLEGPLRRGTSSPDVLRQLRRIFRATGDVRRLLGVVARLAELQPGDEASQLEFLRSLYLAGQLDRAREALSRLGPKAGPAAREALLAIWMDAEIAPERLAALAPPGALDWYPATLAQYCVRRGRADLANKLLRAEVDSAVSLGNIERQAILASALLALGKRTAGEARARAVLSVDPRQPIALLVRGQSALERDDLDSALRDSRVIISDNPGLGAGYQLLAETYFAQRDMLLADKTIIEASAAVASADQLQYSIEYFRRRAKMEQAFSVARNFTTKNPLSRLGWRLRFSVCALQNDLPCVRRSSELLRRLNGGSIDYSIKPEDSALNEL